MPSDVIFMRRMASTCKSQLQAGKLDANLEVQQYQAQMPAHHSANRNAGQGRRHRAQMLVVQVCMPAAAAHRIHALAHGHAQLGQQLVHPVHNLQLSGGKAFMGGAVSVRP